MSGMITPCLWFDDRIEEAAHFYAQTLPDSRVDALRRSPVDYPAGKAGDVLTAELTLMGRPFLLLRGGAGVPFTHAVSFQIPTADQAETDRLWAALTADGGKEVACSWCADRFGLSWQVVPVRLTQLMADPDPAVAARVMTAMMDMVKIDIAALEAAARG